jgi:hypothetical protein
MSFLVARVLLCIVLGGIGIYVGVTLAQLDHPDDGAFAVTSPPAPTQIQRPSPDLSPDDVVRLQVDSLRAFQRDPSAINQCYAFASPANRAATGPLARFTAMVQNQNYRPLVRQTSALVGRAVIRDGQATVFVTVLDESRTTRGFRFFLSRQTDPQFLDCWMTDAVIPAPELAPPETEPAPSPVASASRRSRFDRIEGHLGCLSRGSGLRARVGESTWRPDVLDVSVRPKA